MTRVIDQRVVNLDELALEHGSEGDKFEWKSARVGAKLGARDLGYSYDVVPPGKRSCPFHSHHGEEEMFLILEGEGVLRFGDQRYPIRKYDVIACPTGGPEVAHQIINTGTTTMRYLALSNVVDIEESSSTHVEEPVGCWLPSEPW